ncbi:unnamed protein product [Meloidogyne enterolobii]|uniref:Uncharacterized protein n=1 Tax=Meloidogyne enterolobii TaxID=390850 RepID=A0ACB0YXV4_MELEN
MRVQANYTYMQRGGNLSTDTQLTSWILHRTIVPAALFLHLPSCPGLVAGVARRFGVFRLRRGRWRWRRRLRSRLL